MGERTFIVFIDYSKAFDSVSHIQVFNILNDIGFPREGRTAGMHSISTALLYLRGASNEIGRDNIIRRRYWRKDNLKFRYADDTALGGKYPQEINNIVHKVNYAGISLLKLNAWVTKQMVVGDENANVSIDVDGETIAKWTPSSILEP